MESKNYKTIKSIKILAVLFLLQGFSISLVKSQNWASIGEFNQTAYCVYNDTIDNKLYIGGNFNSVDGNSSYRGIVSWDGLQFDSLGCGLNKVGYSSGYPNPPRGLIRYNNELIVYGGFTTAGNTSGNDTVNNIATWNGSNWSSFHGGSNGTIKKIIPYNNGLLILGFFDTIANHAIKDLAYFDGTNWYGFPSIDSATTNHYLNDVAVYNGEIYVAGTISGTDSLFYNLLKLSTVDSTWQTMIQFYGGFAGVYCMEVYNNELYVAGLFMQSWGHLDNNIIRYDGTNWKPVGGGTTAFSWASITNLNVIDNELYAVGMFDFAGGIPACRIAKWNGTEWCGMSGYFDNGYILDVTKFNNEIYVAGPFLVVDSDTTMSVVKYISPNADTCGVINVGITEVNNNYDFIIYPNPSNNLFTITTNDNTLENTVFVYDIIGNIIWSGSMIDSVTINASQWEGGIYFVSISDGINQRNQKIIKQ